MFADAARAQYRMGDKPFGSVCRMLGGAERGRGGARAWRSEADSVDVLFRTAGGATECSGWSWAAAHVVFENCPPLQPSRPATASGGRRDGGGRPPPDRWCTTGPQRRDCMGCSSTAIHASAGRNARPLGLRWHVPSGVRAHAPQPMLRPADGQGVLAGCTGGGELTRRQRSLAAVVGEICTAAGRRSWVLGPAAPIYRRDVAWLAGHRHPRHGGRLPAAALQEAFAEPAPPWEGVRGAGSSAGCVSRAVPRAVGGTAGGGPGGGGAGADAGGGAGGTVRAGPYAANRPAGAAAAGQSGAHWWGSPGCPRRSVSPTASAGNADSTRGPGRPRQCRRPVAVPRDGQRIRSLRGPHEDRRRLEHLQRAQLNTGSVTLGKGGSRPKAPDHEASSPG